MTKDKLVDLTGNALILILAAVMGGSLLYAYTIADQETKDTIFWFMVTQPQE